MPQARQPKKTEPQPTAVEQPPMATLLLSADELGFLLQMLRHPWAVAQLLEPPEHKHVAGNLQIKAMQAAQSAQAAENGNQPEG